MNKITKSFTEINKKNVKYNISVISPVSNSIIGI